MVRVLALVEGPTERSFGQRVIAPHLGFLGINYCPRVIGTPGHKGGNVKWDRAKREILGLIRQEPISIVTTMFDFYALPACWPGRAEARTAGLSKLAAVSLIEQRVAEAVGSEIGDSGPKTRFIPYLAQHEFEAMLFSDPAVLANVTHGEGADRTKQYEAILQECGSCEDINDDPTTAPSKRIHNIAPHYDKVVDGITVAERIGLARIRQQCTHFDNWLRTIESAGSQA